MGVGGLHGGDDGTALGAWPVSNVLSMLLSNGVGLSGGPQLKCPLSPAMTVLQS